MSGGTGRTGLWSGAWPGAGRVMGKGQGRRCTGGRGVARCSGLLALMVPPMRCNIHSTGHPHTGPGDSDRTPSRRNSRHVIRHAAGIGAGNAQHERQLRGQSNGSKTDQGQQPGQGRTSNTCPSRRKQSGHRGGLMRQYGNTSPDNVPSWCA